MKSAYQRSNEITEVAYTRFRHFEYRRLVDAGDSIIKRRRYSKELIAYLCEKFKIDEANVYISNKPQPTKKMKRGRSTLRAFYFYESKTIKVFNITAVRHQVLSINVFIDQLLHEFMHHYDREYLGIMGTPHCEGFRSRIQDLKNKLK